MNGKRLIEVDFPLRQASLNSVHEKNVRHGHISTLHVWPARRPLAASRAALIATLLPDPGDKTKRAEMIRRLGGDVVKSVKRKKMPSGKIEEVESLETNGGILSWGNESGPDLEWFRKEIRKAYAGRAPRVLDPFAGGGAIPLEAMRLGCDVTAADINPVAWFILKCTLEYPQRLAGQKRPLPEFAIRDREFMTGYLKALGLKPASIRAQLELLGAGVDDSPQHELIKHAGMDPTVLDADLAWHVRAWGLWVLTRARQKLAPLYPTYAEFCRLKPYEQVNLARTSADQLKLVPVDDDGDPQTAVLNAGFDSDYLGNDKNPRWIAKPTVAYLWARTVQCKACRAALPLLKTRWLAKKDNKRVLLTMQANPDRTGVVFDIERNVNVVGGNAAQRREHDKRIAAGTMSRSGALCPCCGTIMTSEDLRLEGRSGRLARALTCVVIDGPKGKEYRLPTSHEVSVAEVSAAEIERVFAQLPFGVPREPTPQGASRRGGGSPFTTYLYGLDTWEKLFTSRQLIALGRIATIIRESEEIFKQHGYSIEWAEALRCYLVCGFDRMLDFNSQLVSWITSVEAIGHTFVRFALPFTWDYSESAIPNRVRGSWWMSLGAITESIETIERAGNDLAPAPNVVSMSVLKLAARDSVDVIVTDPPYYDAIPYSDLMDYFYVWDRRLLAGLSPAFDDALIRSLGSKWDHETNDGELIDDAARFSGDTEKSKRNYEEGMARAFLACHRALNADGRLVIVFAHKRPDAWETLVSAIIKAGFVVDGSWPIQTEQAARMRAQASAALSSSVWLVCRKRNVDVRAGWDTQVLQEMAASITQQLRDFWDAGIRGPDFVWAATGPAMESYSRYPAVRKAAEPGQVMGVSEFLTDVRRIVVEFVVGRVLTKGGAAESGTDHLLDNVTSYYLLHRNDFGLKDAPAGACILYAISCGLSERLLADQYELTVRSKGVTAEEAEEEESAVEDPSGLGTADGSGGFFKLKNWSQRKHRSLGNENGGGRPPPLVDQVHKLMQLWKGGDVQKVNDYLDLRQLRRSSIFQQLLQALIELSLHGDEERAILESLSNHVRSVSSEKAESFRVSGF